jgi:Zn-dependent membrane protease YugP
MSPYLKWSFAVGCGIVAANIELSETGIVACFVAILFGLISLPRHFWN